MGRVEENRELARRINEEIWNQANFEHLEEYFHEDFVADFTTAAGGRLEIPGVVQRAHAAFTGYRETIKTMVADEERVVVHFTVSGTHTGDWGGVAPTGQTVEFDEIVIMTVRDGRVASQIGVIDSLRAMRQLGLLPRRD